MTKGSQFTLSVQWKFIKVKGEMNAHLTFLVLLRDPTKA